MQNPFEYGRELGPGELVDREVEVAEVRDALLGGAKYFLIGPRRYGKTSVHNVGAHLAREADAVVLRYNVEAFETIDGLLATIIGDAGRLIPGPLRRAGTALEKIFRSLRPQVSYHATEQTWTASLGVETKSSPVPRVVEVLHGLEAAAARATRRVGLVLDEVQHLVVEGVAAEQQVRAAVQAHRHVGYVFAGSDTRLLTAMTTDPARPFYRLGNIRFLEEIPRPAFLVFLRDGFARVSAQVVAAALVAILDEAEDVPYNVQLLAHNCWNVMRDAEPAFILTAKRVREVHVAAAKRMDPLFSQLWLGLPALQRRALQAIATIGGDGLFSQAVAERYGLSVTTMQKSRDALIEKRICWQQARAGQTRLRLEDPLFGLWVRETIAPAVS